MKKKNIIINSIITLLVTGLTVFYLIKSGVFNNLSSMKNIKPLGVMILLLLVLIYVLADSLIVFRSQKYVNENARFVDGVGAYVFANLGSNITPSKIGHFPFASYYYAKKGYKLEQTLTIIVNNHLVYSTCLVFLYGIFSIISGVNHFTVTLGDVVFPLFVVGLIGALCNIGYLAGCILIIHNKWVQSFIVNLQAKIYYKLKKIDSIESFKAEKELKLEVYKKCFNRYVHEFYRYIPTILVYVVFMLVFFGLPYFIYLVLSGDSFSLSKYLYFFALAQGMTYVSNVIPVPGGTGVAEYSFLKVYEVAMGECVSSALILWRFLTYFLFIFIGFGYFIYFMIKYRKKEIIDEEER